MKFALTCLGAFVLLGVSMNAQKVEKKISSKVEAVSPSHTNEEKLQLKAAEQAKVEQLKSEGTYNKTIPAKGYIGDFSPTAAEYLKSLNYPVRPQTNNPELDKQNYIQAIENWKAENFDSLEAIEMKVDELNKNFKSN